MLSELAADLSFGLRALKTKSKHQESEERYRLLVDSFTGWNYSPEPRQNNPGEQGRSDASGGNPSRGTRGQGHEGFCASGLLAKGQGSCERDVQERHAQPLIEEKFLRLDRAEIDVEVAAAPVIQKGKKLVQVIFRDISARKRAQDVQRRLATAVEQAAEAIVITDPQAQIQYVNPAFERMTGYTREEVMNQKPSLLRSDEYQGEAYRDLWITLARGERWAGRLTKKRKDGSQYRRGRHDFSCTRRDRSDRKLCSCEAGCDKGSAPGATHSFRPKKWKPSEPWLEELRMISTTCCKWSLDTLN